MGGNKRPRKQHLAHGERHKKHLSQKARKRGNLHSSIIIFMALAGFIFAFYLYS